MPTVKFIVQDPGAALAVAEDRRGSPPAAAWAGDALEVQRLGDLPRRHTLCVVGENPAHHLGLGPVDRPAAVFGFAVHLDPGQHVVAIGIAAGELALLHPAFLPAMGLDADVAQQDLVHRPLHPDQHGIDLALGQRVDLDAEMLHPLTEPRDIGQLPRQPVHRLGQHQVELPRLRIALQRLDPGPEHAGSRVRPVAIAAHHLPALPGCQIPAGVDLVLDRRIALLVRRKPRIERNTQKEFGHGQNNLGVGDKSGAGSDQSWGSGGQNMGKARSKET
nr:hypothetical protein [Rhodobacter sp. SGA-6-6]